VLTVGAAILLLAGAGGLLHAWHERQLERASEAVAEVQNAYLAAMGAQPGAFDFVEPANAEAAKATREEYATKFQEVADAHSGEPAAAAARLEAAGVLMALGRQDEALAAWRRAAEDAPRGSALEALARIRLARELEARGDAAGAAREFERAGEISSYPGRVLARADAARCHADAGNVARALELFAQVEKEKDVELPHYLAARLRELRDRQGAGTGG
jgi:tetratricopeptide (TPR) repeat protein